MDGARVQAGEEGTLWNLAGLSRSPGYARMSVRACVKPQQEASVPTECTESDYRHCVRHEHKQVHTS
jgi:hypothetical protein